MLRKLARKMKRNDKLLAGKSLSAKLCFEPLEARMLLSTWTVSTAGPHNAAAINAAIADGDTISVTADATFTIDGDTDLIGALTIASGKTLTVNYGGGNLKFGGAADQGDAALTIYGSMTTANLGGGGTLDFTPVNSGNTLTISGTVGGSNKTITISDGSILKLDTAASSVGVVTYGDGSSIDADANAITIQGLVPASNGDDLTIKLAEAVNLTVTNAIDLDAGEILTLQGTTGLTSETFTTSGGIVLDETASELHITGDTANSLRVVGNLIADADGVILDLDRDLTVTGVFTMTAGQGDLAIQTGGSTLTATVDVNSNTLSLSESTGTVSTVQMDTDAGVLNVDSSVTVTTLDIDGSVKLNVDSGRQLTVGTCSVAAGKTVELDEAGTISNITFDAASILDIDEDCTITSLTLNESSEIQIASGKTLQTVSSSVAAGKTLQLTQAGTLGKIQLANTSTLDVNESCTISTLEVTAAASPAIDVAAAKTLTLSSVSVSSGADLNLPNIGTGSLSISSAINLAGSLDITDNVTLSNNITMSGDATISVTSGRVLTSTVDVNGNTLTIDAAGSVSAVQMDTAGGILDFNADGNAVAVSVTADAAINTGGSNLSSTVITVDNGAELTVDESGGTLSSIILTDGDLDVNASNTIYSISVNSDSDIDVAPGKILTATTVIASGKTLSLSNTGTISSVEVNSGEILDVNADTTITNLNLTNGAIVDVAGGVTWSTTVTPVADITLRGAGTISTMTMFDPSDTVTKDTGSTVTVTTFNPNFSANGQTLTFAGSGKLTIGNAIDFSTAGGQAIAVSAGEVELSADQTLNQDADIISVASGAILTIDGSVTVNTAGSTTNISAASGSTVNLSGTNKTLTALADDDFKLHGNVNFTGGRYILSGAYEFQLGETLIESGAELEYSTANGSLKFVGGSTVTMQGTAVLDLGASNGSEITIDSTDGSTAFIIDRGPSTTTIDMNNTNLANCTYDSDSGLSAYLDSSAIITYIDFTGSNNANWTNRAPLTALSEFSGLEDASNVITLTAAENALDTDAFSISFKINSLPAKGTLYQYDSSASDYKGAVITAGSVVTDSNGRVVYVTDQDGFGTAYTGFTYVAFDSQVESSAGTVTVSITDVNDPPSFTPAGDVSVTEDSGQYSATWAQNLSVGPNESGQVVIFLVMVDDTSLFEVTPVIDYTGILTFTPAQGVTGSTTVTVMASDNGGTLNDGDNSADSVDFTIMISAENDPPVLTAPSSLEVDDDTVTTVSGISIADSDAGSGELRVILTTQSGTLSFSQFEGTLAEVNSALAGLTYTRGSSLNDTIRIQVDDQGNTGSGGNQSDIEYISVTISESGSGGGSGGSTPGDNGYVTGYSVADSSGMVYLDIDEDADIQAYLDLDGDGFDIEADPAVTLTYDTAKSLWKADIVTAATDGDTIDYGWQAMYVFVDGSTAKESSVLVPNRVAVDNKNPLTVTDLEGNDIKVSLSNASGYVILSAEADQPQDIYGLEITGGDKASLKIKGGSANEPVIIAGNIDIDGGLKSLNAPYVNFEGDVTVDGNCSSIKAVDFAGLTINEASGKIQIKVTDLEDADIQSDSGLVKLIANSITGSTISVEDIDIISSKSSAEFDLTATQAIGKISVKGVYSGDISGLTLNSLVADSADTINVDISGAVNTISIKNDFSGAIDAQSVVKFKSGSFTDAELNFTHAGSITIKSGQALYFENSYITIDDVDKLLLKGREAGTVTGSITVDSVSKYQRAFGSDKLSVKSQTLPAQIDSYNAGLFTVDVI